MGSGISKKGHTARKGHTAKTHGGKDPLQPSLPPQPPYYGTTVRYRHAILNVSLDINARMNIFQPLPDVTFNSTSMDAYYQSLVTIHEKCGYKMLMFVALPDSTKTFGFAAFGQTQMNVQFHGVFRMLFPEETGEKWQLRMKKSVVEPKVFSQPAGTVLALIHGLTQPHSVSDEQHIFQTIKNITKRGGRLISVDMTGIAGQEMTTFQEQIMRRQTRRQFRRTRTMPLAQVPADVFYEVPVYQTSERYVYISVSCPMISTLQQNQFHSVIGWTGVMSMYLGTGWKLVEIFEDYSSTQSEQQVGSKTKVTVKKNCLWLFEKLESRLKDNTPLYEGTMVEHYIQSNTETHTTGFGSVDTNVKTDWVPVLKYMGKFGWQVVRILQTPDIIPGTSGASVLSRQMIFFQRKRSAVSLQAAVPKRAAEPPQAAVPDRAAEPSQATVPKRAAEPPQAAVQDNVSESPQAAVPDRAAEPSQATEPTQAAAPDRATESPQAALSDTATESPQAAVPDRATESPQAAVSDTATESPQAAVPDRATESPQAAVSDTATESPQAAVPDRATESPQAAVSDTATESPQAAVQDNVSEPPHAAVPDTATEPSQAVVPDRAIESPQAAVSDTATESPQAVVPDRATEPPQSAMQDKVPEPPEAAVSDRAVCPPQTVLSDRAAGEPSSVP